MGKHNTLCAGIDTGKRKLDLALTSRQRLQVDNNPEGHSALSAWLRKHRLKRVGIEASGGYEQAVVRKLRRERFVVIVFSRDRCAPMQSFTCSGPKTTRSMPL